MTGQEWTESGVSTHLLSFAAGQLPAVRGWGGGFLSERKLRLVLVACCRRHWARFDGPRAAVETAERFADGAATAEELVAADQAARDRYAPMVTIPMRRVSMTEYNLTCAALYPCAPLTSAVKPLGHTPNPTRPPAISAAIALMSLCNAAAELAGTDNAARDKAYQDELAAQAALVRCIAGNPFRPVEFSPTWRTGTAVSLAKQMYESRDFGAMPILADALQDAGCDSGDVLSHCRGSGPHVRGCWVVDGVLGKE